MTKQTSPSNLGEGEALSSHRYCQNCGRPFHTIPLEAPHKRFCSKTCREQWHYQQRKAARATKSASRKEIPPG